LSNIVDTVVKANLTSNLSRDCNFIPQYIPHHQEESEWEQ